MTMHKQQLEQLKGWFAGYVRTFYTADDDYLNNNIHLKECHTRRVCAEMRALAEALAMNGDDAGTGRDDCPAARRGAV